MDKSGHAEYYQVYVWDLPLRFFHWTNAACVFVLGVTGLIMGSPPPWGGPAVEASGRYLFGSVRFVHFAFAYLFLLNFLGRVYWGFAGNDFARWKSFFPGTRAKRKEVLQVLCLDIFMICKLPVLSIGANALAGIIYSAMYLVVLFQILTGFALYSVMSQAWFPRLFAGLITTMHIDLSWYHDYLEGRGTISSMIGGWKFIEKSSFPQVR
jgi:Ni/Fe-hydrogenase 1 B-type cytochrome subunit